MIHSSDPKENCDCDQIHDTVLKNGCNNFKSLGWNNPQVYYEETDCPPELATSPPCWSQNGNAWPANPPATCSAPSINFELDVEVEVENDQIEKYIEI